MRIDCLQTMMVIAHGPYLPVSRAAMLLGYLNLGSFTQARRRGRLPVETIRLPGRKGLYVQTLDVAHWIAGEIRVSDDFATSEISP